MITVVDWGLGNLGSITNMLRYLGVDCRLSSDPGEISAAERLILPGVGAFDAGMQNLSARGLVDALHAVALDRRRPVLGICLGMQLLFEGSEEGERPGLGWLKGRAVKFDLGDNPDRLRIPHMGWSEIELVRPGRLFPASLEGERFYFVHSYHVACADPADVVGTACHGARFTAAVERGLIMGAQFHPEKSHRFGMRVLKAFAEIE
jgi:glutamine amidotransferase